MSNWTLFSNHGHVLICLSRDSEARLRDVAAGVGITERAVQKIVRDLQDAGMVSITKNGRRNSYRIDRKKPLRHGLEATCTLKDLIKVVNKASIDKPEARQVSRKKIIKAHSVEPELSKPGSDQGKKDKSAKPEKKPRHQGTLF